MMYLDTPLESTSEVSIVCKVCCIMIDEFKLTMDLQVMPINSFDVLLGMDCLAQYRVMIDFYNKRDDFISSNWEDNCLPSKFRLNKAKSNSKGMQR